MIDVAWSALLIGMAVGLPASVLYVAGLAWGMQRALRSRGSGALLMLSFVVRAALLLGLALALGRWLAQPLWGLAGYAFAFLGVRWAALRWARRTPPDKTQEATECN